MGDTSVVFSILATEKVTETLGKIPGAAALAGGAIGMSLMSGIDKAMESESANDLLAAQLGASPEMAAGYGKIAGDLYSNGFGESVGDIDEALKNVLQGGLLPEDAADADVERVTKKVANSAQLMGASYDEVTRAVSQMLRTGIAKNADEAFDILTRGVQQGVNKSGDLLDTFNEYPTEFRRLGLQGPQAMGLLSQAIRAGARDSDVAADALKEFAIRAVDGSKTTSDGFKALGLSSKKMAADIGAGGDRANKALDTTLDRLRAIPDPVKRSQIAVQLFGTQAEDLGDALFAMDPSRAVGALGDVAGAADKAGTTMHDNAGAKLDQFERAMRTTFVQVVGGQVVPILDKLGGWLIHNEHVLGPLVIGMGALATVMGAVSVATAAWSAAQAVASAASSAWTGIQWLLNASMYGFPLVWIIAAVIAVIAVGVLLWKNWDSVAHFFTASWQWIKDAAGAVAGWFSGTLWPWLKGVWGSISGLAVDLYHTWINNFNRVVGFVTGLPGRIAGAAHGMWDGLKNAFRAAINWIIGRWNGLQFRIPGVSFMGVSTPGFTLGVPDLPYLAAGGIVPATPGGRLVVAGEAGRDEAVIPLPRGMRELGGGPTQIVLKGDGSRLGELLLELMREVIRVRGGDVQVVLGSA